MKFERAFKLNVEFYGQKQLNYMMRSQFFEEKLNTTGFSIKDTGKDVRSSAEMSPAVV